MRHINAKAAIESVRFDGGLNEGPIRISPRIAGPSRSALLFWIRRLPSPVLDRLPAVSMAVAQRLTLTSGGVFIDERVPSRRGVAPDNTHAVSYLPQKYIVLNRSLFRRRVELGRIFYHELCHFLWPRLGNPKRKAFADLLRRELASGVRGELGHSSESRKPGAKAAAERLFREYACESFCDTGAYVLLAGERRRSHSEFTLSASARKRRCDLWSSLVMGKDARAAKRS